MQIDADIFSTRAYREIAKQAISYIERYKKPPGIHIRDLLEDKLRKGDEGKFMRSVINEMEKQHDKINAEYVLTQLDEYIELRSYEKIIEAAADAAQAGNVRAVREALSYQPTMKDGSPGIWLHDIDRMLAFLDIREEDFFSSGVDALDDLGVRPARKTMFMLIAPPKRGKSWHCIECGKRGLQHRHKVLHISLENSEELTAQRYIQSLFAMSRENARALRVASFKRDDMGFAAQIDFKQIDPSVLGVEARAEIAAKLKRLRRARLLIKQFATGTLTIRQLNGYLDRLEREFNFVPDLLILDYPDLMSIDAQMIRVDTGRAVRDLRGIAVTRNMAVVAPTQGNRGSADAKVVSATMVAEDWSKVATADTVCTYSQTSLEKELGLARIMVAAARDAPDGIIVMISQSYKTGQFCLDSARMTASLTSEVKRLSGADDDEDEKEEKAHRDDGNRKSRH